MFPLTSVRPDWPGARTGPGGRQVSVLRCVLRAPCSMSRSSGELRVRRISHVRAAAAAPRPAVAGYLQRCSIH